MEQLIITGYIPFTDIQLSFRLYASFVCALAAGWFYWSLGKEIRAVSHVSPQAKASSAATYDMVQ